MAPNHLANPYSSDHEVQSDGSVTFTCSQNVEANPWLALPPHHPVVIQTQSFWTAVGSSIALQGMEATQWSALTWIDWELGEGGGGHAVRGEYRADKESEHPHYSIVLFNAASEAVVTIKGRGVIFRNRNFEKWREGSKEEARKAASLAEFMYADKAVLGLTKDERVLVAPFDPATSYVEALVTDKNGFPPGNPVIGGSGDHVNSTHLHELGRQALFLIAGRTDIDTSGEMTMKRYVELGTPLKLNIREQSDNAIAFDVEQLGKACAEIRLRW